MKVFGITILTWMLASSGTPVGYLESFSSMSAGHDQASPLERTSALDPDPATVIPQEPSEYDPRELKAYYDWRNDMFFRQFDMHGFGRTDFMTARRTYRVWLNELGNPVVLTLANPLFYWIDQDADGKFEPEQGEMWSDPEEDGVNGNERLYDVSDLQSSTLPGAP